MKIGDKVYIKGVVDEIRNDTVIIQNKGGYFGTIKKEILGTSPQVKIVHDKFLNFWSKYKHKMQSEEQLDDLKELYREVIKLWDNNYKILEEKSEEEIPVANLIFANPFRFTYYCPNCKEMFSVENMTDIIPNYPQCPDCGQIFIDKVYKKKKEREEE